MRKKTRDENLARRAKKLLRNWQKLIKPQPNETLQCRAPSLPGLKSLENETDDDKKSVFPNTLCSNSERLTDLFSEHKGETTKTSACGQIATLSSASPSAAFTVHRTLVFQQQCPMETATTDTVKHKPINHLKPPSPRPVKSLVLSKRPTLLVSSDSEPLNALPLNSFVKGGHGECHQSKDPIQNSEKALEQIHNLPQKSKGSKRHQLGLLGEVTNLETEKDMNASDGRKRKCQLKDFPINQEKRAAEDTSKLRVKNRKLIFNPLTQQIKASMVIQNEEQHNVVLDINEPANLKPGPCEPSPSALPKMNWKDLAQNDVIKYYLNLQNNLLKTSTIQTPATDCCKAEHLKREEEFSQKTFLVPDFSNRALPGISRDVTTEDVNRINNKHWAGVNGCQDSKGNWYNWTECISLDVFGDGSRLDILPYVCID